MQCVHGCETVQRLLHVASNTERTIVSFLSLWDATTYMKRYQSAHFFHKSLENLILLCL
jgi:hypothetical protein